MLHPYDCQTMKWQPTPVGSCLENPRDRGA